MDKLKVIGTNIVDSKNNRVILKGLSTHSLSEFSQYVNYETIKELKNTFMINALRLAMYTDEKDGYCVGSSDNKLKIKKVIDDGVKICTSLEMYVIIDWHILKDYNPKMNINEAKSFFSEVSKKYSNFPNVIYEICNEPNMDTSWNDIYEYANEIIPIIRLNSPSSIIIVGTPCWSQRVDLASNKPLLYPNILYTLHFYAATHKQDLRDIAIKALNNGLPIIVSEFGICEASGDGIIDYDETIKWFDFISKYSLSFFAWNISNKNETCALFKNTCMKLNKFSEDDFNTAAKFIIKIYSSK